MDLIIEYLIEKGGIFGVLFALSLAWIIRREKSLLGQPQKSAPKDGDDVDGDGKDGKDGEGKNSDGSGKLLESFSAAIGEIKTSIIEIKSSVGEVKTSVSDVKNSLEAIKTTLSESKILISETKASSKKLERELIKLDGIIENIQSLEKAELVTIGKIDDHVKSLNTQITQIERNVHDLWEWHSVKDADGVPIWYVRRSLEESIVKLKESIESLDRNCVNANKSIFQDFDDKFQKVNAERVTELKQLLENYSKTVTELIIALEKIKFLLKSKEDGE